MNTELQTLSLPDFMLVSGKKLPGPGMRYSTAGTLSEHGDNCVLVFSYYTAGADSYIPWIGTGKALDPEDFFIVTVHHFGGGLSSSPSNARPSSGNGTGAFPELDITDNVHAAKQILDSLGVRSVRLAAGWSLGGMQALHFASLYPEMVVSVAAVCSAARCAPYNRVFLNSLLAALVADPDFDESGSRTPPVRGLNAFGQVYAGWAYSEEFFDDEHFRALGYADVDDVSGQWGQDHQQLNAADLVASLKMWRSAGHRQGATTQERILGRIQARTVLMPSTTDRYFTVAENTREVRSLARGEMIPLLSPLGHIAGRPGVRPEEQQEVDRVLKKLLQDA